MERFCLKFFQKSIFFSEIAWVFSFRLFRLDLKLKPYGSRMSPKWYVDYLGTSNGTPLDDQGFCLKLRREKQYEENACDFGEKIALLYMNSYAKYCIFEWISNATLSKSAKTFINLCTKLISKGNFRFSTIPISSRIGLSWIYPIMGMIKWKGFV